MKNDLTTLFYLRKNQPKKNGEVAIMVRITINQKRVQFTTKLEIHPDQWDTKFKRVIGKTTVSSNLNRKLESIQATISMYYINMVNKKGCTTPEEVKNLFLGVKEKGKTILSFFQQHNEEYVLKVGIVTSNTTYGRYELTKGRLSEFIKIKYNLSDMQMEDINVNFIENFYIFIRDRYKCTNNTSMKFVQRLRAIINYAKNTGLIFIDPFANFKFKYTKVDREILTQYEINLMCKKKFTSEKLTQVRDVYVFCCYTGLAYIDVSELKEQNIKLAFDDNLWIMAKRHKTNINFNVRLLDIPKAILEKYKGKQKNNLALPVISNQKMNDYLKEIAVLCEIDKNITCHTARHTFATTVGLSNGVSIETISKMLGHTNIKTTQIYARITDMKISKDMAELSQKMSNQTISIY